MATDEQHLLGRRDAAVDALVNWIGWLVAVVFVVACLAGWWWGGDLSNLPFIGESVAEAAARRRGWPAVPVLFMTCGAVLVRRGWYAAADRVRGVDPGRRYRRGPLGFPLSKANW
ncbi:hypothetical protein ACFCXK_08745 [Streptomyces sp. NPDC056269]|uniref:hypothetical protein n=1 Tax=Streptomyces sp. NPDC056269 TaxID=3345768 RepID=UPI0035DCFE10